MSELVVVDIKDFKTKYSGLFFEYHREKAQVESVSKILTENQNTFGYFASGNLRDYHVPASFGELEGALKALNTSYWRKAVAATGVMDLLPAKKREEWEKRFASFDVPEFTVDSVFTTIEELLTQRGSFFTDKVDGIFHALSTEHITNTPNGFRTKLIINSVVDSKFLSPNHSACRILDDLACVLYTVNNAPLDKSINTYSAVYSITNSHLWGQWIEMSGGFYKIKLHKSGTAHIQINEESAIKLNRILSSKYPSAIPAKNQVAVKRFKKTELEKEYYSHCLLSGLRDKFRRGDKEVYCSDKVERDILLRLGGKESGKSQISFETSPLELVSEIMRMGFMYKTKSTQFYPTKLELAQEMLDLLCLTDGMSVLEPSAGQGGLIKLIDKKVNITAMEIDPVNVSILKANYPEVELFSGDFLETSEVNKFDRIIMNPPFSEGRAKAHVEKALSLLNKKGILVACLPASLKNHIFSTTLKQEYSEIKEDMFDATKVRVVLVKIYGV